MYFTLHICINATSIIFLNESNIFLKVINIKEKLRGNQGLSFFLIERLAIKSIKTVLSAPRGKLSIHQSGGVTVI